jgi:hypothetical protein
LWKVIKESHQTLTTSKVASVIKKTAHKEYRACKQGMYESIVNFKWLFDATDDGLVASGNQKPDKDDIMMDFLYGLDNSPYAEFKAKTVTNIQKGFLTQPEDLNTIYIMVSRRVEVSKGHSRWCNVCNN